MTKIQTNSASEARGEQPTERVAALDGAWDPLRAWRWHCLYAPVADALRAIAARTEPAAAPFRVLALGSHPGVLQGLLDRAAGSGAFAVRAVAALDETLPFDEGEFDCAAAIDWLPLVPPARRERAVKELGRVARSAVILASPFHSPDTVAAERFLNDAHLAAFGVDHPEFARHLELGLPDVDAVRGWLSDRFKHIAARGLEDVSVWRAAESIGMLTRTADRDASAGDLAATAMFPAVGLASEDAPAYRTLFVASFREARLTSEAHPPSIGSSPEIAALLVHHSVEAAAQRRSFDRLVAAITSEREREREEFRVAATSLAAELREREANAEFLAREIRRRDELIGDQQTAIVELEKRVRETMIHARNMEAQSEINRQHGEAQAEAHRREVDGYLAKIHEYADQIQTLTARVAETDTHASNLDELAKHWREHSRVLEQALEQTRSELATMNERAAAAEARAGTAEHEARLTRAEYDGWRESRGGRALTRYVNIKRSLLGRKD